MEVIHNGTNTNMEFLGIPELPGALRVPFMESPCVRRHMPWGISFSLRGDLGQDGWFGPNWGFGPRRLFWPKLGIWAKTAVLAQTGEGPQAVWDNYHGCEEIFELLGVLPRELTGNRSCLGMCALWWRDWR